MFLPLTWLTTLPMKLFEPKKIKQTPLKMMPIPREGVWGFPGSLVVKNLPANTGDMGSTPGLGRAHMSWSGQADEPPRLKPVCLQPMLHNRRLVAGRSGAPQRRAVPRRCNWREPVSSSEDQ